MFEAFLYSMLGLHAALRTYADLYDRLVTEYINIFTIGIMMLIYDILDYNQTLCM